MMGYFQKENVDITFEQFVDIISQKSCHKKTQYCDWPEYSIEVFRKIYENKKSIKDNLREVAEVVGEAIYAQSEKCALWGELARN